MSTQRDDHAWQRLRAAYEEVAAAPREERTRVLELTCGTDGRLRVEVERLLQAEEAEPDFLAEVTLPPPLASAAMPDDLPPGARVGRYTIRDRLGEGGFAFVYRADCERPVSRTVALKVLKPGVASPNTLARFALEQRVLARLDHPGIARILDAGATRSGRPFVAMELVDGVPITEHCVRNALPLPDRLALFLQLCDAVRHAHQRGVIHRDLKPANVLVTTRDDGARVKVIDFGIAKAIAGMDDRAAPLGATLTRDRALVGTPQYMSPEQAGIGDAPVDVRSDVYALGAILYELVVDESPLSPSRLRTMPLHEILRAIREERPPRPSTRLRVRAREAGAGAERTLRRVQSELDWIVMKALEKDADRRYDGVGDLAADLEAYLAHRPVAARPASAAYLVRTFARRRPDLTLLGALLLATIVISSIALGATLKVARDEIVAGRAAMRMFEVVEPLLDAESLSLRERDTLLAASAELLSAARRLPTERGLRFARLAANALGKLEARSGTGGAVDAWRLVADLEARLDRGSAGQREALFALAEAQLDVLDPRAALRTLEELAALDAADSPRSQLDGLQTRSIHARAIASRALHDERRLAEGCAMLEADLARWEAASAADAAASEDATNAHAAAAALLTEIWSRRRTGELNELRDRLGPFTMEELRERALARADRAVELAARKGLTARLRQRIELQRARVLLDLDELAAAEEAFRAVIADGVDRYGPDDFNVAHARLLLAVAIQQSEHVRKAEVWEARLPRARFDDALRQLDEAAATFARSAADHPFHEGAELQRVGVLLAAEKFDEAWAELADPRRFGADEAISLVTSWMEWSMIRHRFDDALRRSDGVADALAEGVEPLLAQPAVAIRSRERLAAFLQMRAMLLALGGRTGEAETALSEARAHRLRIAGDDAWWLEIRERMALRVVHGETEALERVLLAHADSAEEGRSIALAPLAALHHLAPERAERFAGTIRDRFERGRSIADPTPGLRLRIGEVRGIILAVGGTLEIDE